MYSKQEASRLKKEFWTTFGQYMIPVFSAEGEKINWVNYKTGEKDISFKMNADNTKAFIAVEISHKDEGIQELYFHQFEQLKHVFTEALGEKWEWQLHTYDDHGNKVSRIYKNLEGVSIFKKEDWAAIISFLKPRIVALDEFWSNAKYTFRAMR